MTLRRWRLQTRLIVLAGLVLLLVGAGIGTASWLSVRGSLMSDLDAQLTSMTSHARSGDGPGAGPGATGNPGTSDGGDESSAAVDSALRYLFQPGVGDGALVVVDSGDGGEGLIAEAGLSRPRALSAAAIDALLDVETGGGVSDGSASGSSASDGGASGDSDHGGSASAHESVRVPGFGSYRVVAFDDGGTTTVYGVPQGNVDGALERTAWTTAFVVLIGVLATAALMAVIIHRQLRDLREVARTAREVTDLELSAGEPELALRVPSELAVPGTEVGDVGASVNRMLDHVGSALEERYRGTEQMRRFVADASHELRTPIATIRGWADLTRPYRNDLPAEVATSLGKIDSGAMRMSSLVDDLLLLARLEAGRQPTSEDTVDVSSLLIELVEDAHVVNPDHSISLDVPPEALEVRGEVGQVRRVVSIVLTNACVHTPPGTRVHIEAQATHKPVSGQLPSDVVAIRISDDGPGIPPDIRDRVFDRFVRGDPSRARQDGAKGGSSGLGLAIAAGLVDLMHGSIAMSSTDSGTTFELRLPVA
ncbi:sensor histidine kinase [Brevibacterium atlanticum]|uniref:sensor histidine kinase n=1 Tax=Brevibacterium atlanticum TaxID=2697563 RepID=UPI00141DDE30|nr:HAMP domain-containing sensor histidine kinase [Brevibacterium atlanticum]